MGKDKSAAADKREQVLPAKTEKNAAVETSAAPAKKSRAAGMLRLAAAVLLILAASAAALLYYQKFGLPAAGNDEPNRFDPPSRRPPRGRTRSRRRGSVRTGTRCRTAAGKNNRNQIRYSRKRYQRHQRFA